MRLMSYDLLLEKVEALPENTRRLAGGCLNAIVALERKRGYLEADTVHGNWGMDIRGATVVFYYQIKDCGIIEKYATRDMLAEVCECCVDLDYVDWPDWDNMLCAAFYSFRSEPEEATQYTYREVLERVKLVPAHMQEFLHSCLRRVANFPDVDKTCPLWWFIYNFGTNEFIIGYPKDRRSEYTSFPYEELKSYGLF